MDWIYSIRGTSRYEKVYYPRYRVRGQWVVDEEPFRRRSQAEARGVQLQSAENERARQEGARIKREMGLSSDGDDLSYEQQKAMHDHELDIVRHPGDPRW